MAQTICILYVEDNLENRTLIKRVLEIEGYRVVEAEGGLSGVEKAKTAKPDLILMDINLPDIDGYEATARIRKLEHTAQVPIIALTANVLEGDKQRAIAAGCNGYIPKPIDVDELPRQVKKHLSDGVPKPAQPAGQPAAEPLERPVAASPAPTPPDVPPARPGVRVVKIRPRIRKLPQTGQLPQR